MVSVEGLFFEYRHYEKKGDSFSLSPESRIVSSDVEGYALSHVEQTVEAASGDVLAQITLSLCFPVEEKCALGSASTSILLLARCPPVCKK